MSEKILNPGPVKSPFRIFYSAFTRIYNLIILIKLQIFPVHNTYNDTTDELKEIRLKSKIRTDINDHLVTLFNESIEQNPKLIVELGTRGGESLYVLERVAKLSNAALISVDVDDYSSLSSYNGWMFVQSDDITFSETFREFCSQQEINPEIDILFVDTSHEYKHTCSEIRAWFPFLSQSAKVIFHDTNLQEIYFRNDKTCGRGWNNNRGVIRAIEEYLSCNFNEKKNFNETVNGWNIQHYANCNGFTVLQRTINS